MKLKIHLGMYVSYRFFLLRRANYLETWINFAIYVMCFMLLCFLSHLHYLSAYLSTNMREVNTATLMSQRYFKLNGSNNELTQQFPWTSTPLYFLSWWMHIYSRWNLGILFTSSSFPCCLPSPFHISDTKAYEFSFPNMLQIHVHIFTPITTFYKI